MSVRYIGKRCKNFGLPVWEILMNLRGFGVGRILERTSLTRAYPEEPTYYRIIRVEPHLIEYHPGRMLGNVWTECTFRGRTFPEAQNIGAIAFKDDFRLIHKHEEEAFCNRGKARLEPPHILPRTGALPPLWRELFLRQNPGMDPSQVPEMRMIYRDEPRNLRRVAEEGEEPSFKIGPQHDRPVHPDFYKNVIFSREEAIPYFEAKNNENKISVSAPSSTATSS